VSLFPIVWNKIIFM